MSHKRDDEVSAAAAKAFYEHGYARATVQHVADELGILKGSLYHYIDTKEDLLFQLFEQTHESVGQIIAEVSAAEGLDPLERVGLYVRRQVQQNLGDVPRTSIYYQELDRLGAERRSTVVGWRRSNQRFVADLIERAQAAGLVASGDATMLANCVFATIVWPYRWYRPGRAGGASAVADVCAGFVLAGLGGGTSLAA